jgi:uncharacterized protein YkwD
MAPQVPHASLAQNAKRRVGSAVANVLLTVVLDERLVATAGSVGGGGAALQPVTAAVGGIVWGLATAPLALRMRKIAVVGSLALVGVAVFALAGPLAGAASASPCKRFGNDMPVQLSHRHARMAVGCLLNRTRKRHGLHHLHTSRRLKKAAQKHTRYMDRRDCFDHVCPGEPSVLSRLQHVHYIVSGLSRWLYGENIAYGGSYYGTPRAIVRAWMHSPEHWHNILNPEFRQIGVGFTRGIPPTPGANGSTITTDFGMRKR